MAFTERAEKAGLVIAVGGSVGTALQRWLPMFSTGSLLPSAPGYTGGRSEKQGVEIQTLSQLAGSTAPGHRNGFHVLQPHNSEQH